MEVKFIELNEKVALESCYMGVRIDDEDYKLGDLLPDSYNWLETEVLPEEEWETARLDGTCAMCLEDAGAYDDVDDLKKDIIKSLSWNDNYFGDNVYLIAGDHSCYGTDPGESIIRNAEVVGIIEVVK